MDPSPSPSLSRRSILRLIPAAAVAASAVVLSAKEAMAKEPALQAAPEHPAVHGHRAIIGML